MKKNRKTRSLLAGFGSVALADILANSVVVLLILILITINIKKEQEKIEEEQSEDVSILLSRKLAKSAVVNDIKSSSPALLHDYENSPIDQLLDPRIMPIFEFHDNYVREYYTGEKISAKSLYKSNNAFDKLLGKLNRLQRSRIRIDIYSIKLYYVAMSILKENKISVRHWHFLGYGPGRKEKFDSTKNIFADSEEQENLQTEPEEEINSPGDLNLPPGAVISKEDHGVDSDQIISDPEEFLDRIAKGEVPEDLSEALGIDEETLREFLSENLDAIHSLLYQLPPNETGEEITRSDIIDFLNFLMNHGEILQNPSDILTLIPGQTDKPLTLRTPEGKPRLPGTLTDAVPVDIPLNVIFSLLLDYLQELQNLYDLRELANIDLQEFYARLARILQSPNLYNQSKYSEIADLLANYLTTPEKEFQGKGLGIDQKIIQDRKGNSLTIYPFQKMEKATMEIDPDQPSYEDRVYDYGNRVSLEVYKYPTFSSPERTELNEDGILLVSPEQKDPQEFRWRIVAFVGQNYRDFLIGYAYMAFDKDLKAVFPSNMNYIRIEQQEVKNAGSIEQIFKENLLTIVYVFIGIIVSCLFLTGVLRKT